MKSVLITFVSLLMLCLSVAEGNPTDRIRERLPDIDALKASGQVGESADGYLAARVSLGTTERDLLDAENRDRRALYGMVAARTGQTLEEVGRQRALRLFELSQPGVWLQGEDAKWYQK